MNAHLSLCNARSAEIRGKRSALKANLRSGKTNLAWVLRSNKAYAQTMKLRDILLAVPAIGPAKAERILRMHSLSPSIRLEGVSMKRREQMLVWIALSFPQVDVGRVTAESNRRRITVLRSAEQTRSEVAA